MRLLAFVLAFLLALTGCSGLPPQKAPVRAAGVPGFPITVTDARGRTLTLSAPPQRIVSLAPSNTELLFDLGLGERIVGVTTACDYPPEAKQKPQIGGAYNLSVERVLGPGPDLVVAFGSINQKPIAQLERASVPVLTLDARTVSEVYEAIRLLGRATGTAARAEAIVQRMQQRMAAIETTVRDARPKPGVLIVYSVNPIYTTGPGSFIDELVRIAGGVNVVTESLPQNIVTPERGVSLAPDVILCDPELVSRLKQIPGWSVLPAIRNNRFFHVSPRATLVRPTPRLVDGVEELARYLHPERFRSSQSR
ncbi:MAG: ABC transporter substrate-binding protein [Chloroherpetonaceae bacterium]|nr:ABC transporter substrate-binding protein [Chthonomonadaceae bacterium]MDW8207417.1 ABC transporter substrate-binding protein [Chloroherpetonaceae bacterium]